MAIELTPGLVATVTSIFGGVIGLIGFVLSNNRNENKARSRVYKRVDEEIGKVRDDCVLKDVCDIQHKYTNDKLDGIDKKMDRLLEQNGIKG